jgi:hypothetical protein
MKPYLAILKDSFREAMASRVLLILLIVTTLALVAIVPISLTEKHRSQFQMGDFPNPPALAAAVRQQSQAEGSSPGKQIVKVRNLSREINSDGEQAPHDNQILFEEMSRPRQIALIFNEVLDEAEFYEPAAWEGLELSDETASLTKTSAADLSEEDIRRRNRLLLEAAYPQLISSDAAREVYLGYATYQASFPLPVSKDDALAFTLDFFTDNVLGVFGIMIAILVTASSIPRTYEAGAVDLLLSKPLSRSGVFLTNFVGGCAFILLITSYLIVGMWMIGGLRHGYWNQRFLLCIPLLLFLFSIYYSVSALMGVIWKNAIVSIFVTVAFWCFCFGTRTVKTVVELTIMEPQRIIRLVAIDDTLVASNLDFRRGVKQNVWNEVTHSWQAILAPTTGRAFATAPVYDAHKKRLLIVDMAGDAIVATGNEPTTNRCLFVGDKPGDWNRKMWAYVPDDVMNVFVTLDGRYILVGATGVYEVSSTREVAEEATNVDEANGEVDQSQSQSNSFSTIGPDNWSPYSEVSLNSRTAALVVLRGQNLAIYELDQDGQYHQRSSIQLETDTAQLLAFGDAAIGVSFADGSIDVHDVNTLKLRETYQPFDENRVAQLKASPDGRWLAAVFEHRRLWLYDGSKDTALEPGVKRQGDVSAIAFTPQGGLAVATAFDHVNQYNLESFATERSFQPDLETGPWIYWYLVRPIYNVFPKPGELGDVVTYLVTEKRTTSNAGPGSQPITKQLNLWQPLFSNVAFLSVVLGLACLYVHRKDF